MRKLYLVGAPILFLLATSFSILCKVGILPESADKVSIFLWLIFCVFAYLCIFLKGTLKKSLLSIFIYIAAIVIFVGSSFKMQHWPNGNLLISIGAIGISLFISFISCLRQKNIYWIGSS